MVFKPGTFHGEPPEIEIVEPASPSLEIVAADLLATTDGIDASAMRVTQRGEDIVLSGTVGEAREVNRAVEVVGTIPGVRNVVIDLEVVNPAAGRLA